MQNIGYIIDRRTNEKVKVLWRKGRKLDKYCHQLHFKLRTSGKEGTHFTDEEDFLNLKENHSKLDDLKAGKVITL